ncbi:PDZ domain-containing protein [Lysobacter capsici]|uniref:PDZ domain-containing protein n=1 Tax=Lysobacter capsici TaxID=435897 RepID=UPI0009EB3405|nr:PDZ domain-containing protein [Lysobacter capsici]
MARAITHLRRTLPLLLAAAIGSALAHDNPKDAGAIDAAPPTAAAPTRVHRYYFVSRDNAAAPRQVAQAYPRHRTELGALPDPVTKPTLIRDDVRGPQLGVILAPDAKAGVRIVAVTPDSAAAKAGLRSGDSLLGVGDKTIAGADGSARLANARALLGVLEPGKPVRIRYQRDGKPASLTATPQLGERVMVFENHDGSQFVTSGNVMMRRLPNGESQVDADRVDYIQADPMMAPRMRREIIRLDADCKNKPCPLPSISEALRWNGLNLASVDAKLGRYFGAERGVLVLSAGPELKGLEAGDVIQSIDGRQVDSPREAMVALRGKPDGGQVEVAYLRDRAKAKSTIKVPKAIAWAPPPPPAPPAPPRPPAPPKAPAPPASIAPPDAPAPPAPPAPPPPPPPPAPPHGMLPAPAAAPVAPAVPVWASTKQAGATRVD